MEQSGVFGSGAEDNETRRIMKRSRAECLDVERRIDKQSEPECLEAERRIMKRSRAECWEAMQCRG